MVYDISVDTQASTNSELTGHPTFFIP